jgi:hypothetical protein
MSYRRLSRTAGAGILIASFAALTMVTISSGQNLATCTSTTATFVQAVGFPGAPVLVPMNLPVTLCTIPRHVILVSPGFQVVGTASAPVIVPRPLPLVACPPNSGAAPPSTASGNAQICFVSL